MPYSIDKILYDSILILIKHDFVRRNYTFTASIKWSVRNVLFLPCYSNISIYL